MWKGNEEFCHVIVDTGIFEHHLPDSVLGAVEHLYRNIKYQGEKSYLMLAVNVDTPCKGKNSWSDTGQRS